MKLISFLGTRRITIALLFMTTNKSANARVFWNSFEAAAVNNSGTVTLKWNVTEYNNQSFIIQHSINGNDWQDIAIIQSKNSAESMTNYTYTHYNRLNGKQFYRLKDVDVDTKTIGMSPVKTLVLENKRPASIWPNPATTHIYVAADNENKYTNVKILDLTGKTSIDKKLNSTINEISLSSLSAGVYILKIENSKGEAHIQKIMKQ